MNLAIALTTYQRKDGKSPFYLKRSLDSVFAQEHKDFQLFVIGDNYENDEEFQTVVLAYPQEKIYFKNLERSVEREKYVNDKVLHWNTAGITAMNYASEKALMVGFDYVCHLDHDDYWKPDHLKVINHVIESIKTDFICTVSSYLPNYDLPQLKDCIHEGVVHFLPIPAKVINSSTCYNYRSIPLRYRDACEATGKIVPSDADLWSRMAIYITENDLASWAVNKLTCVHDEEGYLLR